jgi:hypothetical protein
MSAVSEGIRPTWRSPGSEGGPPGVLPSMVTPFQIVDRSQENDEDPSNISNILVSEEFHYLLASTALEPERNVNLYGSMDNVDAT